MMFNHTNTAACVSQAAKRSLILRARSHNPVTVVMCAGLAVCALLPIPTHIAPNSPRNLEQTLKNIQLGQRIHNFLRFQTDGNYPQEQFQWIACVVHSLNGIIVGIIGNS